MLSVLLILSEVLMAPSKIQQIFQNGVSGYLKQYHPSDVQEKAIRSIINCKSGRLGYNLSICSDCGHMKVHANSCRNRNCPNCQAILKEVWIDKRRAEVIDGQYFHMVFTVPAQLNALIFANQKLLYALLHKASSQTLLEIASNPKFFGASPGIIQVLHTWGQELNFHPHIHAIVSGTGLTPDMKLKSCGKSFFAPVRVLASKFRGKFLALLNDLYQKNLLVFSSACSNLSDASAWKDLLHSLYNIEWAPSIKETFNGNGNAIEYLGRYTNRIAITNTRIVSVSDTSVTFKAKDYRNGSVLKDVTLSNEEFVRRLLMHVLPSGFQKIRYYGFLNNRMKAKLLALIFKLQGHQKFQSRLKGMKMDEILKEVWGYNISICPVCGCMNMHQLGQMRRLE